MPLPYKKVRYRFRKISPTKRQRLAFAGNKVVEVTNYQRKNGNWVKKHRRRLPKNNQVNK